MSDVVLDIGGRQRVLRMDLNSLALWEAMSGRSVRLASTWKDMSILDVLTLLWCCAVQADPDVSIRTIGSEITEEVMPDVLVLLERWGCGKSSEPTQTESEPVVADSEARAEAAAAAAETGQDPETIRMLAAMRAKPRG
jgi:hypothetical protein